MNISRIPTGRGTRILFDRDDFDVKTRKIVPTKWAPGNILVQSMVDVSRQVIEQPLGEVVKRTWIVKGRRFDDKPTRAFITSDDEEEVPSH